MPGRRKAKRKAPESASASEDELSGAVPSAAHRLLLANRANGDEDEEDEDSDPNSASDADPAVAPPKTTTTTTPTKRPRGRPKGTTTAKKPRDATPPRDLPPADLFFFQTRPGAGKTSSNTLPASSLLDHESYATALRAHRDPHAADIAFLHDAHAARFPQWWFELAEGFSVCLHGWGSKLALVRRFAEFILTETPAPPAVAVVNGFAAGITPRDVLAAAAAALGAPRDALPASPADALAALRRLLPDHDRAGAPPRVLVLLNSLDAPGPLRRPAAQALLAQLASAPGVALLATCDTPGFPVLWDARTRAGFNWAFHDATTCAAFSDAEVPAVDGVNALLGRAGRRAQGREGAVFVLRSLTESARRLFALLLAEALAAGEAEGGAVGSVEYRGLYRKAVQALIAASEVQFRQLLKEFFDHEMLVNERDGAGTEFLGVPFRREECDGILEELALEE